MNNNNQTSGTLLPEEIASFLLAFMREYACCHGLFLERKTKNALLKACQDTGVSIQEALKLFNTEIIRPLHKEFIDSFATPDPKASKPNSTAKIPKPQKP